LEGKKRVATVRKRVTAFPEWGKGKKDTFLFRRRGTGFDIFG